MSPIDATRAQKMDVWDSLPAPKRSHPPLLEQPPSFAATLSVVPEEEELSAFTPRSAQSEGKVPFFFFYNLRFCWILKKLIAIIISISSFPLLENSNLAFNVE